MLGAAINGLLGKNWSKPVVNAVGIGSISLAFLSAMEAVREFSQLSPAQIPWIRTYFTWITAGIFKVDFSLQVSAPFSSYPNLVFAPHVYTYAFTVEQEGILLVPPRERVQPAPAIVQVPERHTRD